MPKLSGKTFSYNADLIRQRCFAARLLARLNAETAAAKMGYKNTSMISKMEKKTSKTRINFNYLARASLVYGVSMDYLLGMSDYPERDPRSIEQLAIYNSVRHFAEQMADGLMGAILQGADTQTLQGQLAILTNETQAVVECIDKVRELNPNFDKKMRAGASLVRNVEVLRLRLAYMRDRLSKQERDGNILRQFKEVLKDGREYQLSFANAEFCAEAGLKME